MAAPHGRLAGRLRRIRSLADPARHHADLCRCWNRGGKYAAGRSGVAGTDRPTVERED